MTLNTDAIRAEAHALYPPRHWPSENRALAHRVKELCDHIDAQEKLRRADAEYFLERIKDLEERAKDRNNLRERLDVATKDCARLMQVAHEKERDVTAISAAYDATAKELSAADAKNMTLCAKLFEVETRLDAERVGLEVAHRKRDETREALTKAFVDLSNAMFMTYINPPSEAGRALHAMHVAVYNS